MSNNRSWFAYLGTLENNNFIEGMGTDAICPYDNRLNSFNVWEAIKNHAVSLRGIGKNFTHYKIARWTGGGKVQFLSGIIHPIEI